jgi:hypothetical protein
LSNLNKFIEQTFDALTIGIPMIVASCPWNGKFERINHIIDSPGRD